MKEHVYVTSIGSGRKYYVIGRVYYNLFHENLSFRKSGIHLWVQVHRGKVYSLCIWREKTVSDMEIGAEVLMNFELWMHLFWYVS